MILLASTNFNTKKIAADRNLGNVSYAVLFSGVPELDTANAYT